MRTAVPDPWDERECCSELDGAARSKPEPDPDQKQLSRKILNGYDHKESIMSASSKQVNGGDNWELARTREIRERCHACTSQDRAYG